MNLLEELNKLIELGLVKVKKYEKYSVYKYSRKVFFNNLWDKHPLLKEARGLVLDNYGNIIIYPFTKVFNYKENGTTVEPNWLITAPRKVNGFMAAMTVTEEHDVTVSTTGTLDSDFAKLAKEMILGTIDISGVELKTNVTYMFEICHPSDPHIVPEEEGVYLIGARVNELGSELCSEHELDYLAKAFGFKRPKYIECTFEQLLEEVKHVKHEGFMVRDYSSGETLCKIKSPYYLAKKWFQRCGSNKVDLMWEHPEQFKQRLDEEFYDLFNFIIQTYNKEEWLEMTETQRSSLIEAYYL